MKVTVVVTRIYGSGDQYGKEPRLRPAGAPLTFGGFPDSASTAAIDFGPVPDAIVDAERGRRALGRMMLANVFGGSAPPTTPSERFEAALREVENEPLFTEFNWYVTITVTKELETKDDSTEDLDFALTRDAFDLADQARAYASEPLDTLTAVAASVSDPQAFSHLVLDDRVLLFVPGKRAAGVPVLTSSAKASVTRGDESLSQLARRISVLQALDLHAAAGHTWIAKVAHWRVQLLVETDPWKRFLWAFVALEILTHKLFDHFEMDVVSRLRLEGERDILDADLPLAHLVWERERAPLAARFALVAIALFPETSSDDASRFRELKKARDRLSHGSLREEGELPVPLATELLEKYLSGSIKRIILGIDADQPWEAAAC